MRLNRANGPHKKSKPNNSPRLDYWLFFGLIVIGVWWRWFKLDWGNGCFYHPDENNLALSLTRLSPTSLDPNFFAYGPLPGYLVYFFFQLVNLFTGTSQSPLNFTQAVFGLRTLSAVASTFTLLIIHQLAQKIFNSQKAIKITALVSLIPGLIQAAHFGTTESLLTLQLALTTLFSLSLLTSLKFKTILGLAVVLGASLATKTTGLIFFILPLAGLFLNAKITWKSRLAIFLLICFAGFFIGGLLAPFQLLRFTDFKRTFIYEAKIARGELPVFYTRQFEHTWPIVFQIGKIFPYALGLGLAGGVTLGLIRFCCLKHKAQPHQLLILIAISGWFFPNAFLFVKWTRFVVPILPLLPLVVFFDPHTRKKDRLSTLFWIILFFQLVQSLLFTQIYRRPDVRSQANDWFTDNLPPKSVILTEPRNVNRLPAGKGFKILEPDLYSLDDSHPSLTSLAQSLVKADYLIIPSRRLFLNHPKSTYPLTACYYQLLFSDKLGFIKLKEFTSFPNLSGFPFSDELAEETWTVFDHPVIRVYEKIESYSQQDYLGMISKCAQN